MYNPVADPDCYPGTPVLKNLVDLESTEALGRFEAMATGRRFLQSMPAGRCSVRHDQVVHCHIFQDVSVWAGRFREVRISKGANAFCYPKYLAGQMRDCSRR